METLSGLVSNYVQALEEAEWVQGKRIILPDKGMYGEGPYYSEGIEFWYCPSCKRAYEQKPAWHYPHNPLCKIAIALGREMNHAGASLNE